MSWDSATGALCLNWVDEVCVVGYKDVVIAPSHEVRKKDNFIAQIAKAIDDAQGAIQAKQNKAEAQLLEARERAAALEARQRQHCNGVDKSVDEAAVEGMLPMESTVPLENLTKLFIQKI